VFQFTADGKPTVPPNKCEAKQQGLGTKWKIQKNKILIFIDEEDGDPNKTVTDRIHKGINIKATLY
jgi:hypothetical protein